MLQQPLDHPAAVGVHSELNVLVSERFDDKLYAGRRDLLNALLYDVIAVLVPHALHHVALKLPHQRNLLVEAQNVDRLLDDPAPVHLQGEV
mmetsp:Transcript_14632/g.17552  ORF Transcript_14632/g.17552 Transcript_14632/m.17552 type:complete len:91 (+) Transcript_14632:93-365(+)